MIEGKREAAKSQPYEECTEALSQYAIIIERYPEQKPQIPGQM